jgi:serine/threonine protein kinase
VYKSFDHRLKTQAERDAGVRSHVMNERYLPGARVEVEDANLHIISYPYVEPLAAGDVQIDHVLAICRHLQRLHSDGIVHGDIKLGNIVFATDPAKSGLIDFDFSGKEGEKKYPPGFNRDIKAEGERHGGARGGSALQKSHDLHSLAAALARLSENGHWQAAMKVLKGNLDRGVEAIGALANNNNLVLAHPSPDAILATGSPKK